MSTITAFSGSFGSTSPEIVPSIRSYCPTEPKLAPPKVGASVLILICVTRACAKGTMPKSPIPINVRQIFARSAQFINNGWFIRRPPRMSSLHRLASNRIYHKLDSLSPSWQHPIVTIPRRRNKKGEYDGGTHFGSSPQLCRRFGSFLSDWHYNTSECTDHEHCNHHDDIPRIRRPILW